MNQTVTVNISGIVFHIDVDAYENLKKYLNKIRSYFKNAEESEEIMTDIEARIAELFNEKITSENQVINAKDVEEIITIMGKPEQYLDEDDKESVEEEKSYSKQRTYTTAKKLFRDPDERVIGGVASGIAAYFGITPIYIRLFLIVAGIFSFGVLIYLIMWIIMPEAKTASDKLQMKGDPVNIDNLSKTFKDEADKVSDHFKSNGQQYGKKVESAFEAFFSFIGHLLRGVFKVFGKVFGVIFLIAGTFMLVGLLGVMFGSETIFSITSDGVFSIASSEFFNLIFISEDQFHIAIIGVAITVGLPIIMLIYAGANLLFKVKTHAGVSIGLLVLWVVGIFMCAMVGIRMGTELSYDHYDTEIGVVKDVVDNVEEDFYISMTTNNIPGQGILEDKYFSISLDKDSIYFSDIQLRIFESKSDSFEIAVQKDVAGHSRKDVTSKLNQMNYKYSVNGDSILLGNYISTLRKNRVRGQEVNVKMYLPVGKSIYLDKSLRHVIYDIDNVTRTRDRKMLGKKWVMLEDGLTCLDCDEIEGVTTFQLDSIRTYEPLAED
ncbi:MAG: PspC domain-containing protein [Vicingaceae bacterium]|nr:PspC domain-containing protein [Vicingaceae bacterium]